MYAWSLSILAEYGRSAGLVIFFAVLYLFPVYCVLLLAEGEIKRISEMLTQLRARAARNYIL